MHEKLIKDVMELMLRNNEGLRKQYQSSKITSCEETGVGFFANFNTTSPTINSNIYGENFTIGDVIGNVNGIKGAVGFVLFITNGTISCLEGYTVLDKWPKNDDDIMLEIFTNN